MTKRNNHKYLSRYSNNKEVSPAQYITELICEKKAKIDKADLHYRFWLSKKWSSFFRNQIGTANKLLQKYDAKAIVNALLSKDASRIFSLRAPHLLPMIEYEQLKIEKENTEFTKSINRDQDIAFSRTKQQNKNNIFSKLEDIDNGD